MVPPTSTQVPPGIDLPALQRYVSDTLGGGAIERVELIEGGRSNLTYLVRGPGLDLVLRRPPLGHVLATAHDMAREHRFLRALRGTVPVPEPVAHCDDETVLGAPFYLMARVDGVVIRSAEDLAGVEPTAVTAALAAMVDVLAGLHAVDPHAVGLGEVGRPEGFAARQVRRWTQQWEAASTRDSSLFETVTTRLAAAVPAHRDAAIVHGDYRLDNLILTADLRDVAAVLDWEMATLGDPLCDLGLLVAYWDPVVEPLVGQRHVTRADLPLPDATWLIDRYLAASGRPDRDLSFYVSLAYLKLAAIAEGIHARHRAGQTVGEGFDRVGDAVEPLLAAAHDHLPPARSA
ncbi:MAG TPA: phosphotransferase family protein [Acidimicrobiales bacterium]|nr:phosphotransferase family protein [Acidimicrobiales bacterium]